MIGSNTSVVKSLPSPVVRTPVVVKHLEPFLDDIKEKEAEVANTTGSSTKLIQSRLQVVRYETIIKCMEGGKVNNEVFAEASCEELRVVFHVKSMRTTILETSLSALFKIFCPQRWRTASTGKFKFIYHHHDDRIPMISSRLSRLPNIINIIKQKTNRDGPL